MQLMLAYGFDEIHRKVNLYRSNELWRLPNAKILISCRSQWLVTENYRTLFYSCDSQGNVLCHQLHEYTVMPFHPIQIDAYLEKYVTLKEGALTWHDWRQYRTYIEQLPGLKALLSSPFILSLVVAVLPTIVAQYQGETPLEQLRLMRIDVYERFVADWFQRQKHKLLKAGHIHDNCPIEAVYRVYSTKLAHTMLQEQVTSVQYVSPKAEPFLFEPELGSSVPRMDAPNDPSWAPFFAESKVRVGEDKVKLSFIRAGCPLMQVGKHTYAFLHKSLLE